MTVTHPFFDCPKPYIIGHRGAAGVEPENTLDSFQQGLLDGACAFETDLHLTRDGHIVLMHDDVVETTTNGQGKIADMDLAEIKELDAGYRFTLDGGVTFPRRGADFKVPTLDEALDAFPTTRWYLELKGTAPELVHKTIDTIRDQGRENITAIASFNHATMMEASRYLKQTGADIARGASNWEVIKFIGAQKLGCPPSSDYQFLSVPPTKARFPVVTYDFTRHARRHNKQVLVWTVNDADEMNEMLDMGADGLFTDHPGRMNRVLRAR